MNKYRVQVKYRTVPNSAESISSWIIEADSANEARLQAAVRFGRNSAYGELISIKATEVPSGPERVIERTRLAQVADELGVRLDWHEPDEQEVTAEVRGKMLDNAGSWGEERAAGKDYEELHVVVSKEGQPRFTVNLATLLAWATEDKR